MVQPTTEATEPLLFRQGGGPGSLVYNEENCGVGVGDEGSVAVSSVTAILALSTFVAACIAFGIGCSMGYSSPTQSSIMEDLGLSVAEFSLFGSILSIGGILGAVVSGKITDLLGRKLWLACHSLCKGFSSSACSCISFFVLMMDNRIYDLQQVLVYIAEITTKNVRGRFSAIVPLMVSWGLSFMYVVGSFVHWRTLALIAAIPGLLQLLLLFFIPESPRWLAKVGRDKELEAALLCLRGDKADISDEAAEIKDFVESLKSFSKEGIFDIFQKKYVRPLLLVVGMLVLLNLGGVNAFTYYSGVIFVSSGISSMVGLITMAAVQIVTGILGTILIDKSGRRPLALLLHRTIILLKGTNVMTGIQTTPTHHCTCRPSVTALTYAYIKFKGIILCDNSIALTSTNGLSHNSDQYEFHWWDQGSAVIALFGLLMYMGMYVLGAGMPLLLLSELFPINVKGSAGSIGNFLGDISGLLVAYYFNILIEWNPAGIFFIFSAFCFANFVLSATMVPETKGRTLEEIQASITRSSD
ncbi:hypothetical protein V6N13_014573 [Hibiscus sabdariffa]